MPQIVTLFEEWAFRLNDGKSPVSKYIVEGVNVLLEKARIVLSREPSNAYVRPFDPAMPVSPSDIVFALSPVHVALTEYARRHGLEWRADEEDDERF
jgi:hypothetical protein